MPADPRHDIAAFAELAGRPLAPWQAPALKLEKRMTVIAAPRQTGKSRSLSVLTPWWAFRKRNQRVLLISAGEDAAKRLLGEVRAVVTKSPLLSGSVMDELAGLVTLTNGSEIRSVPASEKQIRGQSIDLLIVDEAAYVDEELLLGAALPTISARKDARIVLASSPAAPTGAFYRYWLAGSEGAEHVSSYRWSLTDADWIGDDTIALNRMEMTPAQFAREVLGEFADVAADEQVVERGWVARAIELQLQPGQLEVFGLDVARHGGDESVLTSVRVGPRRQVTDEDGLLVTRRELQARVVWASRGLDLMALAAKVRGSVGDGVVWVDVAGIGWGVHDRLSESGVRSVSFVASARADDPRRHANLRAQAWLHARELFRAGVVDLEGDRVLADQLAAVKYGLNPAGAVLIESKEAMRKSPDRADALVIALWAARQSASEMVRPLPVRPHPLMTADNAMRPQGLWVGANNGLVMFDGEPVSGLSPAEDLQRLLDEPPAHPLMRDDW